MFDTMKTAKKIKSARIAKNMTQMNLADAMEVSYQAVSNWERGNSMPDIAKLEQLCSILQLSMEELLGADSAHTVAKVIHTQKSAPESEGTEPITMEEMAEVLPLLPPAEANDLVDNVTQTKEKLDLSAIQPLAPFLDDAYLEKLIERADIQSLEEMSDLAPFLDAEYLGRLAETTPIQDLEEILCLAPFLTDDALDRLAMKAENCNIPGLISLAPFLSEETLNQLAEKSMEKGDMEQIGGLAPFLSQETLQKIAEQLMKNGDLTQLQEILPFC